MVDQQPHFTVKETGAQEGGGAADFWLGWVADCVSLVTGYYLVGARWAMVCDLPPASKVGAECTWTQVLLYKHLEYFYDSLGSYCIPLALVLAILSCTSLIPGRQG